MPRQSKKTDDKKVAVAPAPMIPAPTAGVIPQPPIPISVTQRVVDNESFLRVRDSAVGRLSTILELLRSFTQDYIRQTNLLLGEATAEGQGDLLSSFETAAATLMMPVPTEIVPAVEEKKERKKRTHDPNAPKRPLTPYFLYMQHARSIIANDLGAEAPKGAVQEEGQRRWANMSPTEKKGWNTAYQYNLRLYNARVHSYKAGNPLAKNMSDEEALKYADDFQIPMPTIKEDSAAEAPANDHDAIAEQLQDEAKTPKKAAPRKRKTATPAADTTITDAAKATPASPDKKRRRVSTKATEDKEEPKKSGRKKTKSS
ncbi:high mobility group protein [Conoideocrella luteorostrata]|uniref:High mobility group protein n=1 Tax=Conoideocrella luteorostrata TaxID=1105319 RepID=A0AAJ0CZP0_9HYPO|nr:high mobility group protein [Conoideocrella luteorostrata]